MGTGPASEAPQGKGLWELTSPREPRAAPAKAEGGAPPGVPSPSLPVPSRPQRAGAGHPRSLATYFAVNFLQVFEAAGGDALTFQGQRKMSQFKEQEDSRNKSRAAMHQRGAGGMPECRRSIQSSFAEAGRKREHGAPAGQPAG